MHNFSNWEKRTAAQCQMPIFPEGKTLFISEVAIAQWFSFRKYRSCAGSRHCASVLQTQVPKLCTDLDVDVLYILMLGTYSKCARKNNFLALSVCFPQPCACAGRRFAASRSRLQYYRRIVSFPQQKNR